MALLTMYRYRKEMADLFTLPLNFINELAVHKITLSMVSGERR